MKKSKQLVEKYVFKLETEEEAKAWVAYVRSRIQELDKKHNAPSCTDVSAEVTANGWVELAIKTEFYHSGYLMKIIYPERLPLIKRELFIAIEDLDISTRVKNILISMGCKNLGDVLCVTQGNFGSILHAGRKSWYELAEMVERYGFSPEHPAENWVFGDTDTNLMLQE